MAADIPPLDGIVISGAVSDLVIRACNAAKQSSLPSSRYIALRNVDSALRVFWLRLGDILNRRSWIHRLPHDVLANVLRHADGQTRSAAYGSCRTLRNLAPRADIQLLELDIYGESRLETVPGLLARLPDGVPVSMDICVRNSCEVLGGFLRQHLSRLRTLRMAVTFSSSILNEDALLLPLVSALETPAPVLETLFLFAGRGGTFHGPPVYVSSYLFANTAPALRSVTLRGITLGPRAYDALSTVRILDLENESAVSLADVLDYYPALVQLRVHARAVVPDERPVHARNLQLLELQGIVAAAEVVLGRLLLEPQRQLTVWMHDVSQDVLDHIVSSVPKDTVRRVQLCAEYDMECTGCVLGLSTGVTLVLELAIDATADDVLTREETMASVVDLSLHEVLWPPSSVAIPAARRLTRVELVLDSYALPEFLVFPTDFVMQSASPFYQHPHETAVLDCPALKEVWLTAPAKLAPPAVDALDVCAFVGGNLRPHALPRLVLRNVHLYDSRLGEGMQRLTAAVSDVVYAPAFVPDIPEMHQRDRKAWLYGMMG